MTPEEQSEIERLTKLCEERQAEIEAKNQERERLLQQIEEYKKIFYGDRGPASVQQIEAQTKQAWRDNSLDAGWPEIC